MVWAFRHCRRMSSIDVFDGIGITNDSSFGPTRTMSPYWVQYYPVSNIRRSMQLWYLFVKRKNDVVKLPCRSPVSSSPFGQLGIPRPGVFLQRMEEQPIRGNVDPVVRHQPSDSYKGVCPSYPSTTSSKTWKIAVAKIFALIDWGREKVTKAKATTVKK